MGTEYRTPTEADWPLVAAAYPTGWTEQHHAWLCARNPAGTASLAAVRGDELVAHAALVSRFVIVQGKPRRFAALTALQEAGPGQLALLLRALFEEHLSPQANVVVTASPDGPNQRMFERVLTRLFGFEVLHTRVDLVRELEEVPGNGRVEVVPLERFDEQARWLHDRCAGAWLALPLFDDAYLNWRFLDRPGSRAEALGARDGDGILRALGVLTPGASSDEATLSCWLAPPEESDAAGALLDALEARARGGGAARLRVQLPPRSPWFPALQERGYRALPAGRLLLAKSTNRRLDDLALRDGYYATAGEDPLAET